MYGLNLCRINGDTLTEDDVAQIRQREATKFTHQKFCIKAMTSQTREDLIEMSQMGVPVRAAHKDVIKKYKNKFTQYLFKGGIHKRLEC